MSELTIPVLQVELGFTLAHCNPAAGWTGISGTGMFELGVDQSETGQR